MSPADQVELGADLAYGGSWWNGGSYWYDQHALVVDARVVLAGAGVLALRVEGSFGESVGVGDLFCTGWPCQPALFEERIGADLGGGGRVTIVGGTRARLSIEGTLGLAAVWVATNADGRGGTRASGIGDRAQVGGLGDLRVVVQIGADVSLHAGLHLRPLATVTGGLGSVDVVLQGVVGLSWVLPT